MKCLSPDRHASLPQPLLYPAVITLQAVISLPLVLREQNTPKHLESVQVC